MTTPLFLLGGARASSNRSAAAEAPRASDYRRGCPRQRRVSPELSAANGTGGPRGVYGQCNATIRSNSHRGIEKALVLKMGGCGCL